MKLFGVSALNRLIAMARRHHEPITVTADQANNVVTQILGLEKRIDLLTKALGQYGRHASDCQINTATLDVEAWCTCGFEDAVAMGGSVS